jgi:hypothetical protein
MYIIYTNIQLVLSSNIIKYTFFHLLTIYCDKCDFGVFVEYMMEIHNKTKKHEIKSAFQRHCVSPKALRFAKGTAFSEMKKV